jgi:hypothetical protein
VGAAAIVPAILAAAGPYADADFRATSFRHSKDFIRFDQPRGTVAAEQVPSFYSSAELRAAPGPIVELPFRGGWSATRSHYVYQTIHRRPVLAAEPYGWPCDERLRLRNHVCPQPPQLQRAAARLVIVHRDPLGEENAVVGGDDSGNRYRPDQWEEFALTAGRMTRNLRRRWGTPLYRDRQLTVWDLDAVRQRTPREPRPPDSGAAAR